MDKQALALDDQALLALLQTWYRHHFLCQAHFSVSSPPHNVFGEAHDLLYTIARDMAWRDLLQACNERWGRTEGC